MSRSPAAVLHLLSRWLYLGVVFLVPITVLPWTVDIFETNKQLVLMLGTSLSAACLMMAMLLERRSLSRPGLVLLAPLVLLVATAASAGMSLAPTTSWIGQGAQEYVSVLSLVGFLLLFYLTTAFARGTHGVRDLILTLLTSSMVTSAMFWPSFLGIETGTFTNSVGAPHAFAVYLLVMTTTICGYWLSGTKIGTGIMHRVTQVCSLVTAVTCFVVLLALDSPVLWVLSMVSAGALFMIALLHAEKFQEPLRFVPAMLLFVVAILFVILPTRVPSPFLQEVAPNLETTWNVVQGSWNEGSIVLGTGPGTFSLMYPKYASLAINQSDFWDLVFDRGTSHVTTLLATIGVVGTLTWIFFVLLLFVLAGKKIFAAEDGWRELVPLFSAWFVSVVASFVYAQNFTLVMAFWVFSALLAHALAPAVEVKIRNQARARLLTVLVTVFALASMVAAVFVTVPRYAAELAFAKAVKRNAMADTGTDVDEVVRLLDKAASTNPWNDTYYRNLAGALLRRLSFLSTDEAANSEYVQSLIATTFDAAQTATERSPANVMNWDVRGLVYRELLPVVPEADEPSIEAYQKAIELAPINPRYRVEVARAYLAIADSQNPLLENEDKDVVAEAERVKEQSFEQAEEQLLTAAALKPDYAPAHYYLALLRERQGDLAEAVRGLEIVRSQTPEDVGVGLQLGLLYLRQGKTELAQAELQRVIELAPAYADAHWYLSVAFEQKGDLPRAITEVEKVLETNPDNVTVKTRLERLKSGQTSDTIPDPISLTTP